MKTETHYVWKVLATMVDGKEPQLFTPFRYPEDEDEPFELMFDTPELAVQGLIDFDVADGAKSEGWILCKQTIEPLVDQPKLPEGDKDEN